MNPLANFVGYSSSSVQDDERTTITFLACCILVAIIWTAGNWAVAAWVLSSASLGDNVWQHVICTTFFGLFGGFLVWVIDRGFIYLVDTQPPGQGVWGGMKTAFGFGVRLLISLLVSSVTALAVMPIVMDSEMGTAALSVLESQERARSERFDIAGLQQSLDSAAKDVSSIERDLKTVPMAVLNKQNAASKCWATRKRNIDALKNKGYSPTEASIEAKPRNCAEMEKEAKAALNFHQKTTLERLNKARELKQELGEALVSDKKAFTALNERAATLVTPQALKTSSTLMQQVIDNDTGARNKYYRSIALIMLIELLPLVFKVISRQTLPGLRVAINHLLKRLSLEEELVDAKHHHAIFKAMFDASEEVATKAMSSQDTQQQLHDVFVTMVLPAVARINAARMVNEQLAAAEEEAHALARKHASLAAAVSAVWENAVNDTAQMMAARDPGL